MQMRRLGSQSGQRIQKQEMNLTLTEIQEKISTITEGTISHVAFPMDIALEHHTVFVATIHTEVTIISTEVIIIMQLPHHHQTIIILSRDLAGEIQVEDDQS